MAKIVVKKLGSQTGGRMFEFTQHATELGLVAGTGQTWEVRVQGTEGIVDTYYDIVFAATNNNDHDRLNFRSALGLTRQQKTFHRLDKALRRLFGIPASLEFVSANVVISIVPVHKRVVLTITGMTWVP
jgi:hypothetical protein